MESVLNENRRIRQLINDCLSELYQLLDEIYELAVQAFGPKEYMEYLIEYSKTQAPQRTAEWYKKRGACITASDISAVLGTDKYKTARKVVVQKCSEPASFSNKYTRWGNQYEPIAAQLYEKINNVKVYDAPLLIHPVYSFIGASCDGFVIDEVNNDAWLIEIKSPYNRIPDGTVPACYKGQTRTQMAVTKVNRCDFFDCKFGEYVSWESFIEDTETEHKGVMFEYNDEQEIDENGNAKICYLYPDLNLSFEEQKSWARAKLKEIRSNEPDRYIGSRYIYWKIVKFCQVTEQRDREWFKGNLPRLKAVWDLIVKYRKLGADKIPKKV